MRLISQSKLLYQLYSAVNEQGCFNHVKAWYHVIVIELCLLEKKTFKKNIFNNIHFNHFHLIFLSAWMCMCGFKKGLIYCYTCFDLIFAFTKFFPILTVVYRNNADSSWFIFCALSFNKSHGEKALQFFWIEFQWWVSQLTLLDNATFIALKSLRIRISNWANH